MLDKKTKEGGRKAGTHRWLYRLICMIHDFSDEFPCSSGQADFLPGIFFRGGGGKIYRYANFFCYANFSIVLGLNFRGGQKSPGEDKLPQGGAPCESQQVFHKIIINHTCARDTP